MRNRNRTASVLSDEFPSLKISHHPLLAHKLFHLRDVGCAPREIRHLLKEISLMLAYEVSKNFTTEDKEVDSGRGMADGMVVSTNPVIVPILRSGLVMAEGFQEVMPNTYTGYIGLHMNNSESQDRKLVNYMLSIPDPEGKTFILIDPVIAEGQTACKAISSLKEIQGNKGGSAARSIRFATIIISKRGMQRIAREHPDVEVYAVAMDTGGEHGDGLNTHYQVVPGIGDVSSRLFEYTEKKQNPSPNQELTNFEI